jgi:hypothetical protein
MIIFFQFIKNGIKMLEIKGIVMIIEVKGILCVVDVDEKG